MKRLFLLLFLFLLLLGRESLAAPFASDTFTVGSDTLLENHTPDVGGSWVKFGSNATASLTAYTANNALGISSGGSTGFEGWYISATPPSAEYDVQISNVSGGTRDAFYLVAGRIDSSNTNGTFYGVKYNGTAYELDKMINGVGPTTLGTPYTVAHGSTDTIILKIRNTGLTVNINGVDQITSPDQTITAAGFAGITTLAPSAAATGIVDSFSATNQGSGGGGSTLSLPLLDDDGDEDP